MVRSAGVSRQAGTAGYRDKAGAATDNLPEPATLSVGREAIFVPAGATAIHARPASGIPNNGRLRSAEAGFARNKQMI